MKSLTPTERDNRMRALGFPVRTSLAAHVPTEPMADAELDRRMREAWCARGVFAIRADDPRLDEIERRFIAGLGDRLHGRGIAERRAQVYVIP